MHFPSVTVLNGSINGPSVGFINNLDTGFYYNPSDTSVRLTIDGVDIWKSTPTGVDFTTVAVDETFVGTLAIKKASATAFAVGPNGITDPMFLVVTNVGSAVTGLKLTGNAAGSRVLLAAISSGANEGLSLDAKGTGTIRLAPSSTGALEVGNATDPAFKVVVATVGTGLSVTSAAAASRVAVAALSSGANEGLDVDAKGSGTIQLGATSTGNIVPKRAVVADLGITSIGPTAGIGYATGAGGAVTQATNKSTGVTLSKVCGQVTMNGEALAAGAEVQHTVTNTVVAATDVVVVSIASGAAAASYTITVDAVAAGSFKVTLGNHSAGSLSEAVVYNFAIVKAVNA